MPDTVQILTQARRNVFKQKNGGDFVLHEAQCVVLGDDVKVGVLKINDRIASECGVLTEVEVDGKKVNVIAPGAYQLEYGLGVAWDDKEIGGVLRNIKRVGSGNAALAAMAGSFDKSKEAAKP